MTKATPMTCAAWSAPRLSAEGAFDLVLVDEGALLVWAPQDSGAHPTLATQQLGRNGAMFGAPETLEVAASASATVVELSAAAAAGQIGLAFVTRQQSSWLAFQAHGSCRAVQHMRPELLSAVEATEAARGRVLVAAGEDGELQVTWRGERGRCEAQAGTCSHYIRRSLTRGAAADRGVIAREMLAPCDPLLIGSLWADGSWYEAVCHQNPDPVAYVFSFRPAISYAEAGEVFAGCRGFAFSRANVGAALWAECANGMAVATRSHEPERNRVLRGVTRSIRCAEGRPILVAESPQAPRESLELALSAPVDGIGPGLPLPFGARAVWTGTRIVAAYVEQGRLRLTSGACGDESFAWCDSQGVRP